MRWSKNPEFAPGRKAFVALAMALVVALLAIAKLSPAENVPRVNLVGNGGKCSLGSGATFHFVGRDFTPNGKVQLLVFYPKARTRPFGNQPNPYGFYWYHKNFGIYRTDTVGFFTTRLWDCRDGPGGTKDFKGSYSVIAVDLSAAKKVTFQVTK